MKQCKIEGCSNKHYGLSYCRKHYRKFKKYNDATLGIVLKKQDNKRIIDVGSFHRYFAVELTQGKWTLVGACDIDLVKQYSWHYGNHGYAAARINGKIFLLHRFIATIPDDCEIDHINHNRLDNRRENLRLCTNSQNHANKRLLKTNTSGYKGVSFDKSRNKWVSYIYCQNRRFHLGYFHCHIEAAKAYDEKAIELFGEFAYLNFPEH